MIRTWDIFDTLIARRCINPQNVFQIVEQISKVKGFKDVRISAEQDLIKKRLSYNFDDIYDNMSKIAKVPPELIEKLKKLEIDVEMDQVIPITENLNQVKSGDVLISDMYLPEEIIRRMLDKVGLFVPVELIVTSDGKASGKVWRQFKDQKIYLFHTGDNEILDVKNSRQYDFDSSWTMLNRLNQFENILIEKGFDFDFVAYIRELRLKNPFKEEIKRIYWELFLINITMLILFIKLIDHIQKKYEFNYLGFCGRDTYYMYKIYKEYKNSMNESIVDSDYLYYSRKLVNNSENDISKYFHSKIQNKKALLVDLHGSGNHLNKLRDLVKCNYSIVICEWIGYNAASKYYPGMQCSKKWINVKDIVNQKIEENLNFSLIDLENENLPKFDNLELLNRATHNSPIKMKSIKIEDKIIPEVIFSKVNDTENLDVFETCMKEILREKIKFPIIEDIPQILSSLRYILPYFNNYANKFLLKGQHNMQESIDNFLRLNK